VLKPGGVAIFTFSNRMFYEKVGPLNSNWWLPSPGRRGAAVDREEVNLLLSGTIRRVWCTSMHWQSVNLCCCCCCCCCCCIALNITIILHQLNVHRVHPVGTARPAQHTVRWH